MFVEFTVALKRQLHFEPCVYMSQLVHDGMYVHCTQVTNVGQIFPEVISSSTETSLFKTKE